jgi:hypothetical protein
LADGARESRCRCRSMRFDLTGRMRQLWRETRGWRWCRAGGIVCHLYRTPPVEVVCTTMNDGFITIVRREGLLWRGYNHGRWLYQGGPVLRYGYYVVMGCLFRCDSHSSGMTCVALRSGNGFFLSRASYNLFLGPTQRYRNPAPPAYTPPTPSQNFCDTHYCIPNFSNGAGVIVQCNDGSWSHSGRQGAARGTVESRIEQANGDLPCVLGPPPRARHPIELGNVEEAHPRTDLRSRAG